MAALATADRDSVAVFPAIALSQSSPVSQFTYGDVNAPDSASTSTCGRNGVDRASVRASGKTWPARISITFDEALARPLAVFRCLLTVRSSRLMSPATAAHGGEAYALSAGRKASELPGEWTV